MQERHGLEIAFQCELDANDGHSSLVEVTTYRVIHEALVNVVRYVETDHAQVRVSRANQLSLPVIDEGKGFEPSDQAEDVYGLSGMSTQVERLHGTMYLRATPGEGTQISAFLSHFQLAFHPCIAGTKWGGSFPWYVLTTANASRPSEKGCKCALKRLGCGPGP